MLTRGVLALKVVQSGCCCKVAADTVASLLGAGRDDVVAKLRMPACYYTVPLGEGLRLVVLDTTEMSKHSGYDQACRSAGPVCALMPALALLRNAKLSAHSMAHSRYVKV